MPQLQDFNSKEELSSNEELISPIAVALAEKVEQKLRLSGLVYKKPTEVKIIAVANQKGGVGKTTTTVNLAMAMAKAGLEILVVDIDPQGNASTALGVAHEIGTPSVYEVLVQGREISEVVQVCPDDNKLKVLPATIDLTGAEIELVDYKEREFFLNRALKRYLDKNKQIDVVLIDAPPSLGILTLNAFTASHEVIIPIQGEYYALEGLGFLLRSIERVKGKLNPELKVGNIILTMYDRRTNLAQQVAEELYKYFPGETLQTKIPRSVRVAEAPSYFQTLITYDPNSSASIAYKMAAWEICEKFEGSE